MCFEFSSCFGNGRREDYGSERSTRRAPQGRGRRGNTGYSGAADQKAPPASYHHQRPTAMDEDWQKAYHDSARKDHHVDAGGNGAYASYVQGKRADKETPKLPAWHNKVGDDSSYTSTTHLHETPAGRRLNAAMDYHRYPTSTTNTTTLNVHNNNICVNNPKAPTPATNHDGVRKDHHSNAGGHSSYGAYVHGKANNDTPKLPAWHNKVGDDTGYTNTYTARPRKAAADRRQNAAMDYSGERSAHKTQHGGGRRGNPRNGAYYGGTTNHRVLTQDTYHPQPPTTYDEAGHKQAYQDGVQKDHHADAGGPGRYTAYVHNKGHNDDAPKLLAWHNKVGDHAGYTYTVRFHEAAADRMEFAAMDYHYYPTTTADTTTLVRY